MSAHVGIARDSVVDGEGAKSGQQRSNPRSAFWSPDGAGDEGRIGRLASSPVGICASPVACDPQVSAFSPWPAEIGGQPRQLVPFARCVDCPAGIHIAAAGTFAAYAGEPLCLTCARLRASGVTA